MKNFVLITALACISFSCAKEDLGTFNALLEQEITLKEGQAALFNNSGIEAAPVVKLKVECVNDSRCPSDARCIAYGKVDVTFRIGSGDGNGESITMCLGDCAGGSQSKDVAEVVVHATPYRITLQDVNPLPTVKRKSNKIKEVQVLVERL